MKLYDHVFATFSISALEDKQRILLYPAASGSSYLLSFFKKAHPHLLSRIVGLGDKDPNKTALRQEGYRVYPPQHLAALKPDVVLITSPSLFETIKRELRPIVGDAVPILCADAMEDYLADEASRSALAETMRTRPFDAGAPGPRSNGWFLCMPLGGGRFSRSAKAALTYRMLEQIRLPRDLSGKSVLDLAASDGFYSFECEARNARSVTAVEGPGWEDAAGLERFRFARDLYGSKVDAHIARVEDFIAKPTQTYDLVLSLGIYYHLRDPLEYFAKLYALTAETLIITGRTIAASAHDPINVGYDQIHGANPDVYTGRAASIMVLSDKKVGKWTANVPCLLDMLRIAGFADVEVLFDYCPPGSFVASTAIAAHKNAPF